MQSRWAAGLGVWGGSPYGRVAGIRGSWCCPEACPQVPQRGGQLFGAWCWSRLAERHVLSPLVLQMERDPVSTKSGAYSRTGAAGGFCHATHGVSFRPRQVRTIIR